jgi:hypothetical protein
MCDSRAALNRQISWWDKISEIAKMGRARIWDPDIVSFFSINRKLQV